MATQNEVCDFYMGLKEAEDQACEDNSNGNRDNQVNRAEICRGEEDNPLVATLDAVCQWHEDMQEVDWSKHKHDRSK